jgi:hypothetical protein
MEDIQVTSQPLQNVTNFAQAVSSVAQGTNQSFQVLSTPQNGLIKAINCFLTNANCAVSGNTLTISLQNYEGRIYFQVTVQLNSAVMAIPLWVFDDLNVEFTRGLYLNIAVGNSSGGNVGMVSGSIVWNQ